MKSITIFLTGILILFFVGLSSAQRGFIKIGDIKGESMESKHKDWIIIESFNQTIQKQTTAATGRRRAAPIFNDVVFTKRFDISTPILMESCATGKRYDKVEMEMIADSERERSMTFYKVTLRNVMISGISSNSTCNPDCVVMEEVSLSYTEVSWEHTDKDGRKVVTTYKIETER